MKLYGFPSSPFVRKNLVQAEEKGFPLELVIAAPHKVTPEFAKASPFKKIPALTDGDFNLADSSAIAHYLEAVYPNPPLVPKDARLGAQVIWLEEFADSILAAPAIALSFNLFVGPKVLNIPTDEEAVEKAKVTLEPVFDYLESIVPDSGWLVGKEFNLADIAVASALRTMQYGWDQMPNRTRTWYDRVQARPSWQKVAGIEKTQIDHALENGL